LKKSDRVTTPRTRPRRGSGRRARGGAGTSPRGLWGRTAWAEGVLRPVSSRPCDRLRSSELPAPSDLRISARAEKNYAGPDSVSETQAW